jgi:hypothetical protein
MNNITSLHQSAVSPLLSPTKHSVGVRSIINGLILLSTLTFVPFVSQAANSKAVPDQATIPSEEEKVWIKVLGNDKDLSWPVKVSVIKQPAHGQIMVSPGNRIRYTPEQSFVGTDILRYQVKDNKGFTSSALVTVNVQGKQNAQDDQNLLMAVPDQITIPAGKRGIWFKVLDNDKNVKHPAKVTITSTPVHGETKVTEKNTINYVRKNGFVGTDSFMYQVVDRVGRKSLATVTVNALGADSVSNESGKPTSQQVTLTWEPVVTAVEGYLVHSGKNSENLTHQLSDLHIASGEIDEYQPSVKYKLDDLNVSRGETICFAVTAYNSVGESEISDPICKTVP